MESNSKLSDSATIGQTTIEHRRDMDTVGLTYAKAHLSELIEWVEAGTSIGITRRGKLVARLTPITPPGKRIDVAALRSLTSTMSPATGSAANIVQSMRDDDRY